MGLQHSWECCSWNGSVSSLQQPSGEHRVGKRDSGRDFRRHRERAGVLGWVWAGTSLQLLLLQLSAGISLTGPDGYPRVLDYSTFEFTTLPYSKNFTTRSSSRVVTISSFCPIIQIFGMGRHHSFLDNCRLVSSDVVAWSMRFRLHYSYRYIG